MTEPVLAVEGATKSFPGVKALDGVDFVLRPGEIHALLGENGAGKSTLIKILTGVHLPDSGTVRLFGEPVRFRNARAAIQAGISAVHQERNLIPRMSVAENIMLEDLPERFGFVDYAAVNERALLWIERLGLAIRPDQPVRSLSVAQMQLVEIAKALVLEARILLMDEPTASITPHETEVLFGLLKQLKDQGAAIVFVSHKLEEVFELCDRVTVLRDGRNACNGLPIGELDRADVVRFMIGRDERTAKLGDKPVDAADVVLRLDGVATSLGHAGIDLELRRGEILGLYGLVGAGRSELAKALVGIGGVTAGTVTVAGQPAVVPDPTTALQRYRIGYVSEDRKGEGLILIHDVGRNIGITIWRRLSGWLGWLGEGRARAACRPFVEKLAIRTPSMGQKVGNLSGGNQQKVSVAKWLAADCDILIVDEPTVGIDIKTKTDLHELLWELASSGKAILLISSDMPEMVALADRILVMGGFRILGEVENDHDYGRMSTAIMNHIHAAEAA
ncbi:MAG: sugar ABC transporter ATP-binding protein [Geminicoccaceae bacterium]